MLKSDKANNMMTASNDDDKQIKVVLMLVFSYIFEKQEKHQ